MKKSKVLIPALAAIAFSTIASVTGTVAWFTSQSAVSISTSSFKVSGLEGSLSVTPTAGVGTSVSGQNENTSITTAEKVELTHGSFDIATKKVYSYDQFSDATAAVYTHKEGAVVGADQVAADFKETSSGNKYNAITWSLTFKYGSTHVTAHDDVLEHDEYLLDDPVNLYYNFKDSAITSSVSLVDGEKNAARGFRVAFLNDADSVATVWSPEQGKVYAPKASGSDPDVNSCYVSSKTATTDYTSANLMYKGLQADEAGISYIVGESGTTDRADFLGQFNTENGGVVTVTCVAWFEGCDPNVVNVTGQLPSVGSSMNFYVKKNVAE